MRRIEFAFNLFSISLLLLILSTCKKDEPKINKQQITGHAQKGPYVNGTTISIYELNASLEQTGKVFTTSISDNSGFFEILNVSLRSGYVIFYANGYYYNENRNSISGAPLILYALSDITYSSNVNVNLLTHLEKHRVEYLVKHNKTFAEAKKIAQSEILAIFGFNPGDMNNSETLDISINNESNAVLIAISLILLGDRSVGELTELLANISNNISEEGILDNETILTNLRNSAKELDLKTIRSSLETRYQELGIDATIPDFEIYVNRFLVYTGKKPESETKSVTNITTTSATLNGVAIANSLNTIATFEYGTSTSYGNSSSAVQNPVTGTTLVDINTEISGLSPGTLYHYRIKTENALGITYSSDQSFTTLGLAPSIQHLEAWYISTTNATLKANVNANYLNTIVSFEYGTTISYGNTIAAEQNPVTGNSYMNVTSNLIGLLPGTTYYFRVRADNLRGTITSENLTFSTLGQSPTLTTLPTTNLAATSATLNATVNANYFSTTVTFEYGTSDSYGSTTTAKQNPIDGQYIANVSSDITGLSRSVHYYARAYGTNNLGTSYGDQISFTTTSVSVGESFQGGLVAYVLQPGDPGYKEGETHGLIIAPYDQSAGAEWGCLNTAIPGADGIFIGTGEQNTIDIVTSCQTTGIAARICYDLVLGGYDDWFLPSKDELNKVFINRIQIGSIDNFYYWSSTENNYSNAWLQSESGGLYFQNKSFTIKVRAIRMF